MLRIIIRLSDLVKELEKYVIEKILDKVVLDCDNDCMKIIKDKKIFYIEDRKMFKLPSIDIPSLFGLKTQGITLDQIFYLAGMDLYVKDYQYPDLRTLSKPICIIDSGIYDKHDVFRDSRVEITKDSVIGGDGSDDIGHGTSVSSIIAYLLPYSRIVSIKIFGETHKEASASDLLKALAKCKDYNCAVVNLSLGGALTEEEEKMIDETLRDLWVRMLFVSAVGNEGWFRASYPARSDYVISVGSVNTFMIRSWFSNIDLTKKKPELWFFGENLYLPTLRNEYVKRDGTSFSTPVVSSLAYLIYYHYEIAQRNQITEISIRKTQEMLDKTQTCTAYGSYMLDCETCKRYNYKIAYDFKDGKCCCYPQSPPSSGGGGGVGGGIGGAPGGGVRGAPIRPLPQGLNVYEEKYVSIDLSKSPIQNILENLLRIASKNKNMFLFVGYGIPSFRTLNYGIFSESANYRRPKPAELMFPSLPIQIYIPDLARFIEFPTRLTQDYYSSLLERYFTTQQYQNQLILKSLQEIYPPRIYSEYSRISGSGQAGSSSGVEKDVYKYATAMIVKVIPRDLSGTIDLVISGIKYLNGLVDETQLCSFSSIVKDNIYECVVQAMLFDKVGISFSFVTNGSYVADLILIAR